MTVMSLYDVWPRDRPLTVDDLERLPDDGYRYELVDGVLEVSPAAFPEHDLFAFRLGWLLEFYNPDDLAVAAPLGLTMAEDHHRIPDVGVVRSEWFERREHIGQPPLLVVEVASTSTRKKDRTTKKREYAEFGIPSYWIGIPDDDRPSLTAFELIDGHYEQTAFAAGDEVFKVDRPYPFTVVPRLLTEPGNAWKTNLSQM
ncbi:Uma2 family endonuclease [Actinopolymorpha alba]|uniref:Uma2 family endonuclease n=1 Tax=Actinopolymorpha alba TaxID=533267 RepID=UPI0003665F01|nr:Uma2 family endonuclease [Actinopolymorpha alba]